MDHTVVKGRTDTSAVSQALFILLNLRHILAHLILPCTCEVDLSSISDDLVWLVFDELTVACRSIEFYYYCVLSFTKNTCRNVVATRRILISCCSHEHAVHEDLIVMNQCSHAESCVSSDHLCRNLEVLSHPYGTAYVHAVLTPCSRHLHCSPVRVIDIREVPYTLSLILSCLFLSGESLLIKNESWEILKILLADPAFDLRATEA